MSNQRQPRGTRRGNPDPPIVIASLNATTNRFEVFEDKSTITNNRSRFDFSAGQDRTQWPHDDRQGWGMAPERINDEEPESWTHSSQVHPQLGSRYSSKEPATFLLNMEIPDKPIFSKVVNYAEYRSHPIIPEASDILSPEDNLDRPLPAASDSYRKQGALPDIPINRVKGAYDSVDQYLYTHFELLRNDCLIPMQRAVKSYRATVAEVGSSTNDISGGPSEKPISSREYRLYEHVRLNAIVFASRQVVYRVSFRLPYYNRVSWPQSKRLIEGTLVLLSKDGFTNDIKIATVVQRGEEPMRGSNRFEYMIDLFLERDNPHMPFGFGDPSSADQDKYVMIEATDGYFEAYRHILSVLKEIGPNDLPFAPNLVEVSQDVAIPHYAAMKRFYDIDAQRKDRRSRARKPVDILGVWPEYQIGMDRTQMDALKTILSNNVAIVQGPPGTGKTFVGTYGMKVLLNNFDEALGPIICICQTNHALDQFLEHVLSFDDRIVRVGSRSKSDMLKEHVLFELRKKSEGGRGVGRLYRKRDEVTKAIRKIIVMMYEEPCVSIDFLQKIKALRPRQLDSLKRLGEREAKRSEPEAVYASSDDSDDDWVISSVPQQLPATSNKGQKKTDDWSGGNPNSQQDLEEPPINPIEVWLRDAITHIDQNGTLSTFSDELKDELLEQQKGLIFEDNTDEDEIIDEDELKEITMSFRDDLQDLRDNRSPYIQIGRAYRKQSQSSKTQSVPSHMFDSLAGSIDRLGRRVIDYRKIDTKRGYDADKINFFDDNVENEVEPQHEVLERWMKEDDVAMWPLSVRLKAHRRWADARHSELGQELRALMHRYELISREIRQVNITNDAKICRENRVVGMTSTAAAKYHDLLQKIGPRVMIVEEAAEMLETHIIAALTSTMQHLILIGDHQQLRPSAAVHELSEHHFLGVSLFERLVMNDIPFTRLSHQRRMRPDIRMLVDPIYKDPPLKDHPDVYKYPPVKGVEQPIYFVSHEEPESHIADTASKCNEHEAQMAAKLSLYLLLQGYSTSDITIITMYSGQRSTIKKALREARRHDVDTSEIRVSSVDGYQGEENKIIILSLVRSNPMGQIGFLKVANRVCVSLSRAKHGMYILGNARILCERSDLWNEIVANLEDLSSSRIGTKLTLQCAKHRALTDVQWPVDFSCVEEGGCSRLCGEILDCGHQCPLKCHAYDHESVRCDQPCRKAMFACGHRCTRRCWETCGSCLVPSSHRLPCGHEIQGECGRIRRYVENSVAQHCPTCLKKC